jgi:hypothetical protein
MPELSPTSPIFVTVTPKALIEHSSRSFPKVLTSCGIRFCRIKKTGNIKIVEKINRCNKKDEGET